MQAFKQKLRDRHTVSLINADHSCAGLVDFVCRLGIDAIMLDCEQGNPSFVDVEDMARAAALHGVSSIVRIPSVEPWTIERYMMRRIDGVVIPRLDTAAQAEKAIADIRYAVPADFPDKTIIVQVESVSAARDLDNFLSIPEVDCFFIGAVDLAKSMGFSGNYGHPDVVAELDRIIARIVAKGRSVGFMVKENDMKSWQDKGASMLYAHVNDFLHMGARQWRSLAGFAAEHKS
ncbi:aldolase/citrate lyase family protein [Pusillimonas sp. SM2304]|uniref:aldolase/citrate lyase family protein n=1 Tax=Pusillimonas sp. SM2304 TaxID=3073241 RepID=UPI002875CFE9|nr:aldolase/citrate lyase family protein [Pusillimonas sp. SM2304]MDS1140070.1 aldolase/citrate lyase family protein [Pusillimonas sp. SM2304]